MPSARGSGVPTCTAGRRRLLPAGDDRGERPSYAGTVPSSRLRRGLAGLIATAVLASVLSACSFWPEPPEGAEDDLSALADSLRGVDAVDRVEASLSQADAKDDPHHWIARVTATVSGSAVASPGQLAEVAGELRDASSAGVTGSDLVLDLHAPAVDPEADDPEAGDAATEVTVDALDRLSVDVADALRHEPMAEAVAVSSYEVRVELASDTTLRVAAETLRPLVGGRRTVLTRDSSSVELSATLPGPALLDRLDAVDASGRLGTTWYEATPPAQGRAVLRVTAIDFLAVATELAATTDEEADAGTRDRTAFSVSPPGDSSAGAAQGWLGLPLGSPEPPRIDRSVPAPASPSLPGPAGPVMTSEEIMAVDATDEEAAVRSFLEASVALTGVEAEVAVDGREQCAGTSAVRVQGHVVAPVFLRYDSAQGPFDAVTARWTDEGLRQVDRALGLDIWAAQGSGDTGVAGATIRGTAEGLSLSATSGCAS